MTILAVVAVAGVAGCQFNKPNKANIALRKESQELHTQINTLTAQHNADVAQIAAMQTGHAVETLPVDRLAKLYTTSSIKFGKLNVGDDTDAEKPGDEGFKITLSPVDQYGDEYKAAGSLTIELFDLAANPPQIGKWSLSTAETQPKWLSTIIVEGYVVALPWQTPPAHGKLIVKATFVDELTGRSFEAQHDLNVDVPAPTSQPVTTQP